MPALYEAYAIYAECAGPDLGTEEMKVGMPNRVFNKVEAFSPPQRASGTNAIEVIKESKGERIRLQRGVYRVNGLSFVSMFPAGSPPVPPVPANPLVDVYPGYCILYDAANPPTPDNMSGALCVGTMGTAYDGVPSIFDCVLEVKDTPLEISLGHQCSYDDPQPPYPKVYLRVGGSDYHVCARIAIFKIA